MKYKVQSLKSKITFKSEATKRLGIFGLMVVIYFGLWTLSFGLIPAHAASSVIDPTDIGVGARPLGMGKAFTAIADDASAIFMNPAGLAKKPAFKIMSMSGNLIGEVPYTVVGAAYPMLGGVVGLGYVGLNIGGIKEATLIGGVPQITGNEGSFNNSAINISYAKDLGRDLGIFKEIKAGATLKRVSQGFSGISSADAGTGSGYDMDLGAVAKINDEMDAGLTIKNIIPGNNYKNDEIPMSIVGGISKKFNNLNLLTALDVEYAKTLLLHAGLEYSPVQMLKIRFGLDQKPNAASTITNMSAGVGFCFKGVTFDYAYHTYAEASEFATHYFSIGFNGTPAEKKAETVVPVAPVVPAPAVIAPTAPAPVKAAPKKPTIKKPSTKKKR